jgi:hypothetical protein
MTEDAIAEVGIDEEHRLFVRPSSMAFPHIWRAAMEVYWDEEQKRLFSPKPREWTYEKWFNQIIWAAANEYGAWLRLTPETAWSGISDELRAQLQSAPLPPMASGHL